MVRITGNRWEGRAGEQGLGRRPYQGGWVRALLLEGIHPDAVSRLKADAFDVELLGRALDEDELIDRIGEVRVLGIRSKTKVSAKVLAAAPNLLSIGAFCIGTDQIDLAAASAAGIAVFNAPFSNTRSVVELALAEIIAMTRRLTEKNAGMHAGIWDKAAEGSHEVRGRTLGIVGYGNIGTQLSVLAENLGMRVIFYDSSGQVGAGQRPPLRHVGRAARTVRCGHVARRRAGRQQWLLSASSSSPGCVRAACSSTSAVVLSSTTRPFASTWRAGTLAGAAVDVFPTEPKGRGDEFVSELRGLPNVILTPHIGGSTEEAQADIGSFVANKLATYVVEGATTLSVNFPPVALPRPEGTQRLVHVHRNTPGVLAAVNGILAEHNVNVEGQLLATRGELGYVVTDVGTDYPAGVVAHLREMTQTVRLRVLS